MYLCNALVVQARRVRAFVSVAYGTSAASAMVPAYIMGGERRILPRDEPLRPRCDRGAVVSCATVERSTDY